MSPGAAPPLPSQLKVHFMCCSANLWLIVESFVSFDQVYPCCLFVCDLPTELSRSHHCLTLTFSGWDTLQILSTSVKIAAYPSLKDERYFDGFKTSLLIVTKTQECNEVWTPTILQVVSLKNKNFLTPNKP